jgi:hypothetical protein
MKKALSIVILIIAAQSFGQSNDVDLYYDRYEDVTIMRVWGHSAKMLYRLLDMSPIETQIMGRGSDQKVIRSMKIGADYTCSIYSDGISVCSFKLKESVGLVDQF